MVKAQKSSGRKSSVCLRRKTDQAEMEDGHLDPQGPPQGGPAGRDQSFAETHYQLENCGQRDAPYDDQERAGSAAHLQAKPMWKPIPPLLPEPHRTSSTCRTREQGCQTDEQLQQTSAYKHGLGNTGLCAEPGDPPLLQQPLQTSKSGIQQIIECFRSGTNELKQMLLKEVDTIFECKLCRSLFRGLPNLITHKEYYCLSRLHDSDGSPGDDRQGVAMKDLLDAIYPRSDRPDYVVRLEPIQTTNKAVFQYITTEEELARYPSHTPSARESPVAWEGEATEGTENNQASQPGAPEADSSPGNNPVQKVEEEAKKEEQPQPEDEGSNSGVEDVTISCCLCGQDFNSRRSIRRHCRKMHRAKLEELRKFTETRTVPTSLLSMVKGGRPRTLSTPPGKSCPVCLKTFATKANVRRHFDEVHQGVRRDPSPSVASRSTQPFSVEVTPPRKSSSSSPTRSHSSKSTPVNPKATPSGQSQGKPASPLPASPQANAASCRCTLCKRNYSSQLMLKRHMRIVHKIYSVKNNRSAAAAANATAAASTTASTAINSSSGGGGSGGGSSAGVASSSNSIRVKEEAVEPSEDGAGSGSAPPAAQNPLKVKEEEPSVKVKTAASASSSRGTGTSGAAVAGKMTKLSVGFDFKQLFCKLCKRQFSSRQNLTKHIELHTDGNDIFIKFYRCPLCRYESRRKRDVLRHVTVVHKKSSTYLAKIMPKLESRAVKRLAEVVLNSTNKRTGGGVKEEVNGRHASSSSSPSPSMPVTRKQDGSTSAMTASSASAPSSSSSSSSSSTLPPAPPSRKQDPSSVLPSSPPVTRKQDRQQSHQQRPVSPPQTRRSEKHSLYRNSSSGPAPAGSPASAPQAPHTRRHDAQSESSSTEVKVTKNFSLHACDQCGRAFAKKLYLESHKRSHRNATSETSRRKGVSTRSKSLVW